VRGIPEPLDLEERLANLASDQVVPGGAWAMFLNPEGRDRQSIRLKGYDYSRVGAYFVTICTQGRACLFGEVVGGAMRMSAAGQMTLSEWEALPTRFPTIELGAFVVMPNHVHGIIVITPVGAGLVPARNDPADADGVDTDGADADGVDTDGADTDGADTDGADANGATTRVAPTVGGVVGAFKSWTTVLYTRGVKQSAWPAFRGRLWQRNYYEHVIRNEESLMRIHQYIVENPLRWAMDRENPQAIAAEPERAWLG